MLFGKLFLLFVAATGTVLHVKEKRWTDPTKFPGAQVIEQPVDAIDAWDDIEKCSKGRDRAFEKVQWVVADSIPFYSPEHHVVAGGIYWSTSFYCNITINLQFRSTTSITSCCDTT